MNLPAYVINLENNGERWRDIAASAEKHAPQIALRRIDAANGRAPEHSRREIADIPTFHRMCGRDMLPGEYGCYVSHLKALRAFLDDGAPFALILEDDVAFEADSGARIAAILDAVPEFGIVKVVNHRTPMMIRFYDTARGDGVGRVLHGPQGSSAGYLVSREGARHLLDTAATMVLPWDVTLERAWVHGAPVFTTRTNVLGFSEHRRTSSIAGGGYGSVKFRWYRRLGTAAARIADHVWRAGYALERPPRPAPKARIDADGAGRIRSVAVAVCTRDRPEMLREALRSLAALELEGIDCRFIVVENNDVETVTSAVGELAEAVGADRVAFRLEPRLGIAFARNAALDAALDMGVDALAFIDDDEVAETGWLAELVRVANRRELDLVGGPAGLQPAPPDATASERTVWRGLAARCRDMEAKARRLTARGRDDRLAIVTNNWLTDLGFVRRAGLRFDEALGLSGGEDVEFFRALRQAGGKSGWAPDALVREIWPRERLTLAYQFQRGRDQALARHRAKYPEAGPGRAAATAAIVAFKAVGGALRAVQAAFDGGASLVRAARAFGAAAGVVAAVRGRRSHHYETVSGG